MYINMRRIYHFVFMVFIILPLILNVKGNDVNNSDKEKETPPYFKNLRKPARSTRINPGGTIEMHCSATGNPLSNITWTRNDKPIKRHFGKVTYKEWSIELTNVIGEDSGVYKCLVCNIQGCIKRSNFVIVTKDSSPKPIISKFPQNQTAITNSSFYMECRVPNDIKPYIFWLKFNQKNQTIEELDKLVQKFFKEQKDAVILEGNPDNPNILNFTKISHEDEGWYTCVAINSGGKTWANAYLTVKDKFPQREKISIFKFPLLWILLFLMVLVFILATSLIVYIWLHFKQKNVNLKRSAFNRQSTKVVVIHHKLSSSKSVSCDLQMPNIKIKKRRNTFSRSTSSTAPPPANNNNFIEYELPLDTNWEIPRSELFLGSSIGLGTFGRVVMARGSTLAGKASSTIVAVKMVKEEHTDNDMASLVREMEVLKMLGQHINIIKLLGCCSQNGPLWLIKEFAAHGNLKDFLKKNGPVFKWDSSSHNRNSDYLEGKIDLTDKLLLSFAFQIAKGMKYLASKKFVHCDLAACNILVSHDFVMKISGFDFAPNLQDSDFQSKTSNGHLPFKWLAPESLQERLFDSQSVIWSYGVLLWEIWTYGEQPYNNIIMAEELYCFLKTEQRLEKPPRCSLNIYVLMRQCWQLDSKARPLFTEIVENLDKLVKYNNEEYLDFSMPILESQYSCSDEAY